MIDLFILLTPILLLVIVALLGFVGCSFHASLAAETITLSPTSGPPSGGDSITITGTNSSFSGTPAVNFGTYTTSTNNTVNATATNVVVTSKTTITATTPAGPPGQTEVWVTYTDAANQTDTTESAPYTYVAIGFVQTGSNAQATNPPISVTLNNTAQGNLLIAAVSYGGPAAGSVSVSDNLGNAFILAGSGPWFRQSRIFYLPNIPGGNVTIKATGAGGATGPCSMCVSEYSGAVATSAAVYGFSTKASPSTGTAGVEPVQGVNVSLAQAGDFAYVVVLAAQPTSLAAGSGFTSHPSATASVLVEDSENSITAAQQVATVDSTGGGFVPWVALAVAIKA